MKRSFKLLAGVLLTSAAACSSDHTSAPVQTQAPLSPEATAMLADGFATTAAGFGETNNSFVAGPDLFAAWMPMGMGMTMGMFHATSDLMGGGLGDDFAGGMMFDMGHGPFDHGPFAPFTDRNCSYSASSGRVVCPTLTMNGLTITRSFAYSDASGKTQQALDSTTNTVNSRVAVSGTMVSRHGDTTKVNHASDQTVAGLVKSSTKRVVNGTSAGTESTNGTNAQGNKFTSVRAMGDTTAGLTIPVQSGKPTYPSAGTVTRSMKVTVTIAGQQPATSTRREVVTYDGSATAKIVITQDGVTKTCTMPLPRGKLACS